MLSKNLIRIKIPWTGPLQGDRVLFAGPENEWVEILLQGACQKNSNSEIKHLRGRL